MASATNSSQIAAARKRQARDREIDRDMIVLLMSKVDGRRWLWLKLEAAHLYHEDGVLGHAEMAYAKGKQSAALALMASVTGFCPDMYVRMLQENSGVKLEVEEPQSEESENG